MPPGEQLLSIAEVARLWHVSARTVQRYIADGKLKALRLPGGGYRIRPEDADAALAETTE
jgi:excisionase family DNA binding protein